MTEQTPRNNFPYPSEREEPFFDSFKSGMLAIDAAAFANADNSNIVYTGGGTFSWDATTGVLFWTDTINANGHHSPFGGYIIAGSTILEPDEVLYYQMPRLVQGADVQLTLYRGSRLFLEGARLHDLRLFAHRKDDTVYFANGLSLKDGDTGILFGQGLLPKSTILPHMHEAPFVYTAPASGLFTITPMPIIVLPDLFRLDLFRNGLLQVTPDDYTLDATTGIITLVVPTTVIPLPDKFVVWRETRDTSVVITSHEHGPKLVITPPPATVLLSALATSPILLRVDVFRNGQLLVEGAGHDYTVDLSTGLITLLVASVAGDKFEIMRELAV